MRIDLAQRSGFRKDCNVLSSPTLNGGHVLDARMLVLAVVPVHEVGKPGSCMFKRCEASRHCSVAVRYKVSHSSALSWRGMRLTAPLRRSPSPSVPQRCRVRRLISSSAQASFMFPPAAVAAPISLMMLCFISAVVRLPRPPQTVHLVFF